MIKSKDLDERLNQLGWKVFHLAKQVAEIRANRGNVTSATRLNSTIAKAIDNPAKSGLETLQDIVTALGGEINIVWEPENAVTVRLADELIEALSLRANVSGVTVAELAEQLLQQALQTASVSGKHLSSSGASNRKAEDKASVTTYRAFHLDIASAYTAVHEWLATREEATGYRDLDYSRDISRSLDQTDLQSAAFQYYSLFQTNYFKAAHFLDSEIVSRQLLSFLNHNPKICILDVGCAAGAASAAFVEAIFTLQKKENLSQPVEIFAIGLDSTIYGITLYNKLMHHISQNVSSAINLQFQPLLYEGIPKANKQIRQQLQKWKQNCLSNLWVMQLNLISSLSQVQSVKQEQYNELKQLGLEPDLLMTEDEEQFGQDEALLYKQLFEGEGVSIDHMPVMTIGTKNLEKRVLEIPSTKSLDEHIKKMTDSLIQIFGSGHPVERVSEGKHKVYFKNPVGSYWRDRNQKLHSSIFYASYCTVNSANLPNDDDWQRVTNLENLELAWARVRQNLLTKESFYDDVEIRLFENNLNKNLTFLQQQLISYYDNVAHTNEQLPYKSPKNQFDTRPRELSRLEDEILSVAIIQQLGNRKLSKLEGHSYAYRLGANADSDTEYLYQSWFNAYKRFIKDARRSVQTHKKGAVIRTDIKSFYTKILQGQLIEEVERQLDIRSQRIKWLLQLLLSKKLDKHEIGIGLTQGNIGSGFWANIYLTSVDARFDAGNEWNVKFYRYLDDMILIVPNPEYVDDVLGVLKNELDKLNLTINKKKTEVYSQEEEIIKFLEETKDDEVLEQLSKGFDTVINPLWIMTSEYRTEFEEAYKNNDRWWSLIERYRQCLRSLNIYVTEPDLSRKISKYLFNSKRRKKDLNRNEELNFPPIPNNETFTAIADWSIAFCASESKWIDEKNNLRKQLIKLFRDSWIELSKSEEDISITSEKELQRRIRFAVNKLSLLGLADIQEEIVEILCEKPFVLREPLHILESLARQGCATTIRRIREYHRNSQPEMSEYMRAVSLQAMRFLPNINKQDWELLVESATMVESVIEKLKATETWLYLGDVAKRLTQPQHISAVVKALQSESLPRLKKNYILILGLHDPTAIPDDIDTNGNDYLLRDALDLALEENPLDLFEEYEPPVIRQNYYSAKTSSNTDEEAYS